MATAAEFMSGSPCPTADDDGAWTHAPWYIAALMAAKETKQSFEEHLGTLERIVEELESGELTLDAQLERYQEGVERLKTCYDLLRDAEQRVKKLVRSADGDLVEEPFEEPGEGA